MPVQARTRSPRTGCPQLLIVCSSASPILIMSTASRPPTAAAACRSRLIRVRVTTPPSGPGSWSRDEDQCLSWGGEALRGQSMSSSVTRTRGPGPDGRRSRTARSRPRAWSGDLVTPSPGRQGTVGQHHRDLFTFPEPEPDGLEEQVPHLHGLLARVLDEPVRDVTRPPDPPTTTATRRSRRGGPGPDRSDRRSTRPARRRRSTPTAPATVGVWSRAIPACRSSRASMRRSSCSSSTTASSGLVAYRVSIGSANASSTPHFKSIPQASTRPVLIAGPSWISWPCISDDLPDPERPTGEGRHPDLMQPVRAVLRHPQTQRGQVADRCVRVGDGDRDRIVQRVTERPRDRTRRHRTVRDDLDPMRADRHPERVGGGLDLVDGLTRQQREVRDQQTVTPAEPTQTGHRHRHRTAQRVRDPAGQAAGVHDHRPPFAGRPADPVPPQRRRHQPAERDRPEPAPASRTRSPGRPRARTRPTTPATPSPPANPSKKPRRACNGGPDRRSPASQNHNSRATPRTIATTTRPAMPNTCDMIKPPDPRPASCRSRPPASTPRSCRSGSIRSPLTTAPIAPNSRPDNRTVSRPSSRIAAPGTSPAICTSGSGHLSITQQTQRLRDHHRAHHRHRSTVRIGLHDQLRPAVRRGPSRSSAPEHPPSPAHSAV